MIKAQRGPWLESQTRVTDADAKFEFEFESLVLFVLFVDSIEVSEVTEFESLVVF